MLSQKDLSNLNAESDLKELVVKNLALTEKLQKDIHRIKRFMFWRMVVGWLWFIIIVGPIILAFFYLPPLLKDFQIKYQNILGEGQNLLQSIGKENTK